MVYWHKFYLSLLFWSVPDIYTLRSVSRKKILSMPGMNQMLIAILMLCSTQKTFLIIRIVEEKNKLTSICVLHNNTIFTHQFNEFFFVYRIW